MVEQLLVTLQVATLILLIVATIRESLINKRKKKMIERFEKLKAWIAALRSDKYTQGRCYLVKKDDEGHLSHCCLGVACEVAGLKMVNDGTGRLGYEYDFRGKDEGEAEVFFEFSVLPRTLVGEQAYPRVFCLNPLLTAINANDSGLLTFPEIADVLESVYLGDGTKAEKILTAMYMEKRHLLFDVGGLDQMRRGFAELKQQFIFEDMGY